MICGKCRKTKASFFLSSARFDERVRIGLCDECAEESGVFSALFKVETMLHGYGFSPAPEGEAAEREIPVEFAEECGACGMDLRTFEREFRLGCDHCCHIFGSLLFNFISLLEEEPGAKSLKPLYPGPPPPEQGVRRQAQRLRQGVREAVECEDYLEAERRRETLDRAEARLESRHPAAAQRKRKSKQARLAPASPDEIKRLITGGLMNPSPCGPWLRTHIEIRRNIAECIFPERLDEGGREVVRLHAEAALAAADGARIFSVARLPVAMRLALENHLFSRRLSPDSSIIIPGGEGRLIVVNDGDHFCFTYSGPESGAAEALADARSAIPRFAKKTDFAFSPRFGYLTAAPKNMGAGISVSVLMHLPYSLAAGRTELYPIRADRAGVRFSPYRGNSVERHGFFRVRSVVPFNATEERVVERVFSFARSLENEERRVRENLTEGQARGVERLAGQALAHIRRAYRLSYQDALRSATFLSIGAEMGNEELAGFSLESVLPGLSSPHIMYLDGRRYTVNECEKRRAEIFCERSAAWRTREE